VNQESSLHPPLVQDLRNKVRIVAVVYVTLFFLAAWVMG